MAKGIIKTFFNDSSLRDKLEKIGEKYGDTQDQAIKRWGVQTCRELAKYQQPFDAKNRRPYELLFYRDAYNVLFVPEAVGRKTKKGNRLVIFKGRERYISNKDFLETEIDIHRWIEGLRKAKNGGTIELPKHRKKWCSKAKLKKIIMLKLKATAGLSKDGWLDAAEEIGKGQRGASQAKIAKGYLKFARKPLKVGTAKQTRKGLSSFGELVNKVTYAGKNNLLSEKNKKKAIRDGAQKTIKFYEFAIRAENKKRK